MPHGIPVAVNCMFHFAHIVDILDGIEWYVWHIAKFWIQFAFCSHPLQSKQQDVVVVKRDLKSSVRNEIWLRKCYIEVISLSPHHSSR